MNLRKWTGPLVCLGMVSLLQWGISSSATEQAVFNRPVKHVILPAPPIASIADWQPSGKLSPDGRWLAYFDARPQNSDKVVFYDVVRRRHWIVNAGRTTPNSYSTRVLAWRQDSRACAIGASGGWRIAWPDSRRTQRVSRTAVGGESSAAWSPHTKRLAMFEGFLGNGLYRVWNGRRLTRGVVWRKAVDYPYGEERAWQCEWSPDEKLLLFRFYGHAERDSDSAGHTAVVNPQTGRRRFKWGAETGPAQWLDNSRLIFEGDDRGVGLNSGLVVAQPITRQSNLWLKNCVAWTLSAQRDTIWALTTEGHLCRTPSQKRQWQIIRRNAVSPKTLKLMSPFMSPIMSLSPRGDMVAFHHMFGGTTITVVSTSRQRPWTLNWRAPVGKVKLLGWQPNHSLPLLELERQEEAPLVVMQLTK